MKKRLNQNYYIKLININKNWISKKEETIHSKQEIQSLVTHISHQVKTPLANIKIYNDLLARNDLSKEEAIDFHIMLNQQINKLDFLLESLIKMSRLETDIIQIK